ncbi:hypothetical protein EDD11_000644 [Mortierella claussenii]|nr:hypothetical protein EDD11_000644 [Mortierella claussenii]
MSTTFFQNPIALRNPYSALDAESEPINSHSADHGYSSNSRAMLTRAASEDDLDRVSVSSWSVVNSAYATDDEDDQQVEDEIYIDASTSQLAPLTVSALTNGFTNISKTMTATSINSSSAATAEPNAWVVRVSKKRQHSSRPRTPKTAATTAPFLEDVVEGSESDGRHDSHHDEDKENMDGDLYMSMTEHELSKSAKAVKLKNVRLATAHDTELCRVLHISERNANGPKLPKCPTATAKGKSDRPRVRSVDLE